MDHSRAHSRACRAASVPVVSSEFEVMSRMVSCRLVMSLRFLLVMSLRFLQGVRFSCECTAEQEARTVGHGVICSGSEEGSYLRLIDFVYHSTLGLRVIKQKRRTGGHGVICPNSARRWGGCEGRHYQPSEGERIVCFNCREVYHKSPDSGELQDKSRI